MFMVPSHIKFKHINNTNSTLICIIPLLNQVLMIHVFLCKSLYRYMFDNLLNLFGMIMGSYTIYHCL